MDRTIRIGKVSAVDYERGMIRATYPDLDNSVTAPFPVLSFNDEYKLPEVGAEILVLHLSNGQSMGLVLGKFWNDKNKPPKSGKGLYRKELAPSYGEAFLQYEDGVLTIKADAIRLEAGSVIAAGVSVAGHKHEAQGALTTPPIKEG